MTTEIGVALTKDFPTCDVLSTITGVLIAESGIGVVYEVLNWATGESVFTHQLPRISKELRAAMVAVRPELGAAVSEAEQVNPENWHDFAALWLDRYGPTIAVPKLGADEHERIDPMSELAEIVPPDRIIVVKP
jgi:hypothetical protein